MMSTWLGEGTLFDQQVYRNEGRIYWASASDCTEIMLPASRAQSISASIAKIRDVYCSHVSQIAQWLRPKV
jgi:hypothetical protein